MLFIIIIIYYETRRTNYLPFQYQVLSNLMSMNVDISNTITIYIDTVNIIQPFRMSNQSFYFFNFPDVSTSPVPL